MNPRPTTPTGKRMAKSVWHNRFNAVALIDAFVAIETEARAQERERLRPAIVRAFFMCRPQDEAERMADTLLADPEDDRLDGGDHQDADELHAERRFSRQDIEPDPIKAIAKETER